MRREVAHVGADVAQGHIDLHGPVPGLPAKVPNSQGGLATLLEALRAVSPAPTSSARPPEAASAPWRPSATGPAITRQRPHPAASATSHAPGGGSPRPHRRPHPPRLRRCPAPRGHSSPEPALRRLALLSTKRRQLLALHTAERNRSHRADPLLLSSHLALVETFVETFVETLDGQIAAIDAARAETSASCARFHTKADAFASVKGVGTTTALALLAAMPELGTLSIPRGPRPLQP